KDIKVEFKITEDNIKSRLDCSREELDFTVIDDENKKKKILIEKLDYLKETTGILKLNGDETKCGIVFTPNVNGYKGCVDIANILQKHFQTEVRWFAGSTLATGFTRKRQSEYTRESQKGFKENQFSLIVATKAFGMGINKPNIHYTFHYGIPMSIEGLYQEAGRAGRDRIKFKKEKAQCLILLSKSDETHLSKLWERETPLSIVKEIQEKDKTSGDINTNLFLFCKDLEVIPKEFSVMKSLYTRFAKPNQNGVKITWKKYKRNELTEKASQQTERAIYKLSQIGVVKDWTINHKDGCFEVDFNDFSEQTILTSLLETIRKYDPEYSLVKLEEDSQHIYQKFLDYLKRNHNKTNATDNALLNPSKTDKYMLRLLDWHDENFIYSRRQSLRNVYKWCCDLADKGGKTKEEFKKYLEDYFRFSETTDSLQIIAETPANYKEWFKVFYQPQSSRLKTKEEQQSLRSSLSRFLETYKENSGLNLISGLLHLLLDDYEDRDGNGKSRLEGSLEKIQKYGPYEKQYIIEEILKIGKESDDKNKALLAKSLHKFFDSGKFLYTLHGVLNDSYSLAILLQQASNRLQRVKENLNDGLKEIG
ncbi:MAG: helicase-related protein, partial [Candidatus Dadabacteria bacterium]|nr:helicase-related protein [Candidatus Dadabacteria bacterium]